MSGAEKLERPSASCATNPASRIIAITDMSVRKNRRSTGVGTSRATVVNVAIPSSLAGRLPITHADSMVRNFVRRQACTRGGEVVETMSGWGAKNLLHRASLSDLVDQLVEVAGVLHQLVPQKVGVQALSAKRHR
jgi:hypothetical protein